MDLKIAAARTHQAIYERLAPHPADLRTWIEELNGAALKDPESDIHFVGLFVAIIDPEQRELAYINAGVVEPYFYRAKQRSVGRLKKNLPALGLIEAIPDEVSSVPLAHGDMLLCTNDELHGEYGEARVTSVLEEAARAEASPESTIRGLFARLDEFGIIPDAQPAAPAVRFSG